MATRMPMRVVRGILAQPDDVVPVKDPIAIIVVRDGEVVVRYIANLCLSFDHRVMDL